MKRKLTLPNLRVFARKTTVKQSPTVKHLETTKPNWGLIVLARRDQPQAVQKNVGRPDVRAWFLYLSIAILTATGCGRGPLISGQIKSAGGTPALKRDCQLLFEQHLPPPDGGIVTTIAWTDELSKRHPIVAAMRADRIMTGRWDGMPVVDLLRIGGADQGLMIFLTNTPAGYIPIMNARTISKVEEGLFEYRERQ